ncbi:MAG: nucleotidyltransferase [Candidatus Lokiarchaeota archaeon]|nr:nucleotidyltransferase [Candidatus Lokiarchaeota archaeon]
MSVQIDIPKEKISEFCKKHGINKLMLFGSVLRSDFSEESDVDILVEFDSESIPTYFELSAMQDELSSILGRKVDLRTPNELSHYFRERVMTEAVVQYHAG